MENNIEDWLEGQLAAGTTDSIGEFTLNPAKAWAKLGASALPTTYSWVIKLVQSAVRLGTGLDIKQSRQESVFTWGKGPAWGHTELSEAVFSLQECPDPALAHLAVAVRALAASRSSFRFWLEYSDGNRAQWNGQGFELSSRRVPGSIPMALGVAHALDENLGEIGQAAVSAEIARTLCGHVQWSPRKITLDGRDVSNIFEDPVVGRSRHHQPLCLLAAPPRQGQPGLRVRANFTDLALNPEQQVRPDPTALARAAKTLAEPAAAVAVVSLCYFARERGSAHLAWVSEGVEVLREVIPLPRGPLALLVACSAEGLETDISGLALRDTKEKRERKFRALEGISECFQQGAGAVTAAERSPSLAPLAGGVAGLLTCVVSPVLGVLTLVGSLAGFVMSFTGDEVDLRPVRRDLQKLATDLKEHLEAQKL